MKNKGQTKKQGAPLGQHFLTRPEIAGWVAEAAGLTTEDMVLEVGPGHGILTRELLTRAGQVVAIEKDPVLVAELHQTFAGTIASKHLVLLEEDVRDFNPSSSNSLQSNPYSLVANIPYYITGRIIRQFLTATHQPTTMALLVQKEVAERVVARDGKESLLSLSVKAYGTPRIAHTVRAGAFSPPPKVDSAVLVIENISRARFQGTAHEEHFFALLHAAFSEKRKQIGGTLRGLVTPEELTACNLDAKTRPEDVSCEEWVALAALPSRR